MIKGGVCDESRWLRPKKYITEEAPIRKWITLSTQNERIAPIQVLEKGNVTRIDGSVARYVVVAGKEDPWQPRQLVNKSTNSCTAATGKIEDCRTESLRQDVNE